MILEAFRNETNETNIKIKKKDSNIKVKTNIKTKEETNISRSLKSLQTKFRKRIWQNESKLNVDCCSPMGAALLSRKRKGESKDK